jgi:cytochrome c-type biogenesis protein CcmH/NrfF
MTALLWARPMFAAILIAVVGLYVWTACRTEAEREPGDQPTRQPRHLPRHRQ